jgi:predicted ATPase
VSLRDLGEHRVKDLGRSERVFQAIAPDLPSEFPPLRALDSYHHNLPTQATVLIGRETEVLAVRNMLRQRETRLLTLTGPGGIGKTRLALQAGAELLDDARDGVFFVALAPIHDPQLVVPAIARELGMADAGELPLLERLKRYLHPKQILLVLDNFEQVADASAPAIAEICYRLDGLPLAIELAAARSRIFTPQALLARLAAKHRLSLLTGGARDLPMRQQTLRDAIAWSYDLLDVREQALFARLGCLRARWKRPRRCVRHTRRDRVRRGDLRRVAFLLRSGIAVRLPDLQRA